MVVRRLPGGYDVTRWTVRNMTVWWSDSTPGGDRMKDVFLFCLFVCLFFCFVFVLFLFVYVLFLAVGFLLLCCCFFGLFVVVFRCFFRGVGGGGEGEGRVLAAAVFIMFACLFIVSSC